jgi:hypothetical protein
MRVIIIHRKDSAIYVFIHLSLCWMETTAHVLAEWVPMPQTNPEIISLPRCGHSLLETISSSPHESNYWFAHTPHWLRLKQTNSLMTAVLPLPLFVHNFQNIILYTYRVYSSPYIRFIRTFSLFTFLCFCRRTSSKVTTTTNNHISRLLPQQGLRVWGKQAGRGDRIRHSGWSMLALCAGTWRQKVEISANRIRIVPNWA